MNFRELRRCLYVSTDSISTNSVESVVCKSTENCDCCASIISHVTTLASCQAAIVQVELRVRLSVCLSVGNDRVLKNC